MEFKSVDWGNENHPTITLQPSGEHNVFTAMSFGEMVVGREIRFALADRATARAFETRRTGELSSYVEASQTEPGIYKLHGYDGTANLVTDRGIRRPIEYDRFREYAPFEQQAQKSSRPKAS